MNANSGPLVSIIVPVYNVESNIRACLDSLVMQSYPNLQILVINDGSTDSSPAICEAYACIDKRIHVVHQANGGVSSARNKGLELAIGDFIQFVDSDDWLEKHAVARLVDVARQYSADCVIFEYFVDYDDGRTQLHPHQELAGRLSVEAALETTISPINRFLWSKFYSKQITDGIQFRQDIHLGEDTLFACMTLEKATSVYYLAEPLYHYIQSAISATRNTVFKERRQSVLTAYGALCDLCRQRYPSIYPIARAAYMVQLGSLLCDLQADQSAFNNSRRYRLLRKNARTDVLIILKAPKVSISYKRRIILCAISPRILCWINKFLK